MLPNQKLYTDEEIQVLLFPLRSMYISQGENGQYSHQGTLNMDFLGYNENGRVYEDAYFAPCDMKCVYKSTTGYYNIWESLNEVYCADGIIRKVCLMNIHGNLLFDVGTIKLQGEQIGRTGSYGYVTGDHAHFNISSGEFQGQEQVPPASQWQLKNSMHIYNACFINDTTIYEDFGYSWKIFEGGVVPPEPPEPPDPPDPPEPKENKANKWLKFMSKKIIINT